MAMIWYTGNSYMYIHIDEKCFGSIANITVHSFFIDSSSQNNYFVVIVKWSYITNIIKSEYTWHPNQAQIYGHL